MIRFIYLFIYIEFIVFYTKLTHLAQKFFFKKKKRLDGTRGAKLDFN